MLISPIVIWQMFLFLSLVMFSHVYLLCVPPCLIHLAHLIFWLEAHGFRRCSFSASRWQQSLRLGHLFSFVSYGFDVVRVTFCLVIYKVVLLLGSSISKWDCSGLFSRMILGAHMLGAYLTYTWRTHKGSLAHCSYCKCIWFCCRKHLVWDGNQEGYQYCKFFWEGIIFSRLWLMFSLFCCLVDSSLFFYWGF